MRRPFCPFYNQDSFERKGIAGNLIEGEKPVCPVTNLFIYSISIYSKYKSIIGIWLGMGRGTWTTIIWSWIKHTLTEVILLWSDSTLSLGGFRFHSWPAKIASVPHRDCKSCKCLPAYTSLVVGKVFTPEPLISGCSGLTVDTVHAIRPAYIVRSLLTFGSLHVAPLHRMGFGSLNLATVT